MDVRRGKPPEPEDRFAGTAMLCAPAMRRRERCAQARMMEAVTAELSWFELHRLKCKRLQPRLHRRLTGKQPGHGVPPAINIS